jgi:hypothetical protein
MNMNTKQSGMATTTLVSIIAAVAVIVVVAGAIVKNNLEPKSQVIMTSGMKLPVTVPLNAQNGSGQSGNAVITEENGQVKITVDMNNSSAQSQPADIHFGSCANPGQVKYVLTDLNHGHSETLLDISIHDLHLGTFSLNVHKSDKEADGFTACGDVSPILMQAMQ